jgi:hypothetical protein
MGSLTSKAFIDPNDLLGNDASISEGDWWWGMIEVLSLMLVYGVILFKASNMLAEGSELLLLVPSISGIVGSVVLPILGAVPDGAIMLFSGMGPDAQENLAVGVGALAGSTVMLLTIPWAGAIWYGRVPVNPYSGLAVYGKEERRATTTYKAQGVSPDGTIRTNAYIVVATSVCYLVIQGPAFQFARDTDDSDDEHVYSVERWFALIGLLLAVGGFCGCARPSPAPY